MFTGLVEACVAVSGWESRGSGGVLRLPSPGRLASGENWGASRGESISVSGACLTVCELLEPGGSGSRPDSDPLADMLFELSRETLDRTCFGQLTPGRAVNLERSLRMGDRLGGHLVSGHVDGLGRVEAIEDVGDGGRMFTFSVDPGLDRYLIEKGSVALDGISLTVVGPGAGHFQVAVIPETLERTNLGSTEIGRGIHVEVDQIGKWIEKLLPGRS